jgi:hypothetical protein
MKPNKPMIIALCIIGSLALLLIIPKLISSIQFNSEVKQLFSLSKPMADMQFSYAQLDGLPEPVQLYFKLVMKENQPYISYARLSHNGQFKTGLDKDWIKIEGEQYFTTQKPGFIWRGSTTLFTARDMYIGDKGRLVVSILSLINIVDAKGEQYNQGELLRWLAESVWFPTNLLPSENLGWTPIDSHNAKLTFNYQNLSLVYKVTFNEKGEISQMETKRYMNETHLETWIGRMSDYKELNGILVPTKIEALWKLEKGEFSYAKFNIIKIEFDIAEKF